jgi:hypothetical protein
MKKKPLLFRQLARSAQLKFCVDVFEVCQYSSEEIMKKLCLFVATVAYTIGFYDVHCMNLNGNTDICVLNKQFSDITETLDCFDTTYEVQQYKEIVCSWLNTLCNLKLYNKNEKKIINLMGKNTKRNPHKEKKFIDFVKSTKREISWYSKEYCSELYQYSSGDERVVAARERVVSAVNMLKDFTILYLEELQKGK